MYTQTTTTDRTVEEGLLQTLGIRDVQEVPVPARYEEREQQEEVWKPSRVEMLREYPINIEFLTIGCIVSVGCKKIPFTLVSEAMKAINEYVEQPYEMKQKWEKLFEENK